MKTIPWLCLLAFALPLAGCRVASESLPSARQPSPAPTSVVKRDQPARDYGQALRDANQGGKPERERLRGVLEVMRRELREPTPAGMGL
ncbi:MAG: hypothetical protein ABFE07_22370, partial [Armatimonadia bacterium]